MMRLSFVVVALLVAAQAAAGSFTITIRLDGVGTVGTDPLTADVWGEINAAPGPCVGSLCHDLAVEASLHSGAFLGVTMSANDTRYEYADGILVLTAQWTDGHGASQTGTFTAGLFDMTTRVKHETDGYPEGPMTQDTFRLGAGQFDQALADLLGVDLFTGGGEFSFFLEAIDGTPGDAVRYGNLNEPRLWISGVTAVPEPSMLALLTVAAAAAAAARRHA